MPSGIICLGDWIKGSTTICNCRLPEYALKRSPSGFCCANRMILIA